MVLRDMEKNSVVPLRNGKVCSVHMLKSKDHEYYALNQQEYKAALHMEESSDKEKKVLLQSKYQSKNGSKKGIIVDISY